MLRKDRERDAAFAWEVFQKAPYATLSLTDEVGKPYAIPISPVVDEAYHVVYFHCAGHGEKWELLAKNPPVCLSAVSYAAAIPNEFSMAYASAVLHGRAEVVTDEAEQVKAKAKLLREQYQQKQRDYQDLKEETLKVVRGTSRLNVDLLNNLIEETTVQMAELEGQIRTAEAELREVLSGAEQVRQEYAQLMDWAGLYDNCSFEAKKMIAAQFVKAVRVKRGYEVDIEFNVSFEEFQTLYLEPESEEDRRSRSATYLSLVEKSGQAG